jgi:hypothetical protein
MAADNGACLPANNVSISCTPLVYGFKNYVDFTIPAANLKSGLNTLDFTVNNISGPTALSVHFYVGCLQPNSVYTNLPANGTVNAWTINFGFAASDSVTTSMGTIDHFCFYLWTPSGSTPLSAEVSVTSSEFGGTTYFDENVNLTCTSYCKAGYPMHGGVCGGTSGS